MSNAPLATGASARHRQTGRNASGRVGLCRAVSQPTPEYVVIPLIALLIAAAAVRTLSAGDRQVAGRLRLLCLARRLRNPFSLQNTLQRSAPLILTALAVAIPARIGLIMIGGEGALVLGGFAAAVLAIPMIGRVPPHSDAHRSWRSSR